MQSLGDNLFNDQLAIVNQRSTAGHWIRKQAAITGSTYYTALGFDGLKKQQTHYNKIVCGAQPEEHDTETLKKNAVWFRARNQCSCNISHKSLACIFPSNALL